LNNGAHALGFVPHLDFHSRDYLRSMNTREMTDKVQGWQRRASEKARNLGSVTDEYVRENTWTTIAVAAVIGCVLGYLLASRND
jgi:ElaB/YqjD/DUF883 family membrane-anchored ribosome-binding protein